MPDLSPLEETDSVPSRHTAQSALPELSFRALADRTRLRILHLLLSGELCVCEIVETLEIPQPTASRHLRYLRKAGLIEGRKSGLWHYYRLSPLESPFETALLRCLESLDTVLSELPEDRVRLNCRSGIVRCEFPA